MSDSRRSCIKFALEIGLGSDGAVHPHKSGISAPHSCAKGGIIGGHGVADFDIIFACAGAAVAIRIPTPASSTTLPY